MSILHPRLDHGAGETPVSYASRLARLHGETVRSFCRDVGIAFQALVDGGREAVGRLAELARASVEALSNAAIVRVGPRSYAWRGEALPREALRRSAVWVCPRCLREDAEGARARPEFAPYNRTVWQLAHLRTCARHGLELRPLPMTGHWTEAHDFASVVAPFVRGREVVGLAERERHPSDLEAYLSERFGRERGAAWLDGLSWHAAAETCQMLGAVVVGGRDAMVRTFGSGDWLAAGSIGFAVATEGEVGIRDLLAHLDRTYPRTRAGTEGPQAVFGTLWEWLYDGSERQDLQPVHDLVRRYVRDTTPVGPENSILGSPVDRRVIHSVYTAALETGRHPKTIRKILRASGVIGPETDALNDHAARFEASSAREVLRKSADCVTQLGAQTHINAGRVQMSLLVGAGHVQPFVLLDRRKSRSKNKQNFAVAELEAFMTRLLSNSVEVDAPDEGTCTIPEAAKRACCGAMEIVALILDGRLGWVGRLRSGRGYMSVLVRPAEIKTHVRGAPIDGLTKTAVSQRLGTTGPVIDALLREGHLTTFMAVNPLNRCPISLVPTADVEGFKSRYVSLSQLGREMRLHPRRAQLRMVERGIAPTFRRETYGATFYRRSDLT